MKIAWIVCSDKLCGISQYAAAYAAALAKHAALVECSPEEFARDRKSFLLKISGCDIAHIQYEPSFFFKNGRDFYPALCDALTMKKVVTLHEIYNKIPGVFPREDLGGGPVARHLRQWLWDRRHPQWAAFGRHASRDFHADALLAHAKFHRELLERKGVTSSKINVIPLPVAFDPAAAAPVIDKGKPIVLGATGFINPQYDYALLLDVLEELPDQFHFSWVGGVRRPDDAGLARFFQDEIDRRGLRSRCIVSGVVSGEQRDRLFSEVQIVCAFFKDRSSSESLARSIGARKYIVATRLPLTEELVADEPLAILADGDSDKMAARIRDLIDDESLRRSLEHGCAAYARRFSYEACSRGVMDLYERLLFT